MAIKQKDKKISYLIILSFICTSISCSSEILGNYCDRSFKDFHSTLKLKENHEFVLQTNMLIHEPTIYFETGSYFIVDDSLTLLVHKQGSEMDSLLILSNPVTFKGFLKKNKIIFYGKKIDENFTIFRKCSD